MNIKGDQGDHAPSQPVNGLFILGEGQFDVGMDGITITDERKQQVDFSVPYMVSQQFMLVRADETRFTTISYGKEKPLCTEAKEACWSQNRRGEFKLK